MAVVYYGTGGHNGGGQPIVTCLSSDAKPAGYSANCVGLLIETDTNKFYRYTGSAWQEISVGGGPGETDWGGIGGTIADQTDLQAALDTKSSTTHDHAADYEPKNTNIQAHVASTANPHSVTKAQVGLANADNTSDASKPVSSATQTALDGKASTSHNHDSAYAPIAHSHSGLAPTGGTTGQVLKKNTNTNYDYSWQNDEGGVGGTLGYTLSVQALTSSPSDGQTVYFGQLPKAPTSTANISKVYVRKAGTIKMAQVYCYSGTAGTNESWSLYIRLNNTTDTLIQTLAASTSERIFTNSSLSIAVVAGDYFEIKSVQPTWVTNPLTTIYGGYVYIE